MFSNPNTPIKPDAVGWPEFSVADQKFLELGEKVQVITAPNKERLHKLKQLISTTISRHVRALNHPVIS